MTQSKQTRIEQLEKHLAKLQGKLDRQTNRAAWYRAKLLKFVTTKWIAEEKRKDGI